MAREVRVAILGDSRDYHRAVTDAVRDSDRLDRSFKDVNTSADRSFRGIGDSASRMRAVVATAAAGAAYVIGNFAVSAIRSASDLQETISLTNTVFGDVAPFVQDWAKGAARGFGQSRAAALRTAGAFGNLFRQTGFTTRRAAELSTEMTELASDFASFHNADTVQVTDAMTAAFRGEYDALQRFVPTINAARVEAEALRQTGKAHAEDLTAEDRALAVYTLTVQGAGDAMGDFDRTSGGLANQQRILSAQWEDLKTKIGEKFLPVATAVVSWANDALPQAFANAQTWIDNVRIGWEEFTTAVFGEEDWESFWSDTSAGWQTFSETVIGWISNIKLGWDTFTDAVFGSGTDWDSFWTDVGNGVDVFQEKWAGFTDDIADGWRILMENLEEYTSPFMTTLEGMLELVGMIAEKVSAVGGFFGITGNTEEEEGVADYLRNLGNRQGTPRTGPNPTQFPVQLPTAPLTPVTGPFQEGGIVPGPRGSRQLAMVHAGETILPTHTDSGAGGITLNVYGEPDDFTLRRLRHAAVEAADAVRRSQAWSVS